MAKEDYFLDSFRIIKKGKVENCTSIDFFLMTGPWDPEKKLRQLRANGLVRKAKPGEVCITLGFRFQANWALTPKAVNRIRELQTEADRRSNGNHH
tara:strand:- start:556 stop:843 length:288 start_codon:yes stop_codon:yes gene_type:complete